MGPLVVMVLLENFITLKQYRLCVALKKATEGKPIIKANVRMKPMMLMEQFGWKSNLNNCSRINVLLQQMLLLILLKIWFNSNNTELVLIYHANESGAALEDTYIYLDDFVEEAPEETALELKELDFSVSWPRTRSHSPCSYR